jgi:hypothetical protein
MKGLTVDAQLFLSLRVDVVVGGVLFIAEGGCGAVGAVEA